MKKLQRRFESTEEELHKKRAELREALRNDAVGTGSSLTTGHGGPVREIEFTSKKFSAALPKIELKSPARVMEEKSCGESSRSSRSATPPISASALQAATQAAAAAAVAAASTADLGSPSDPSAALKLSNHLRRRSGTPASIRSRVSILNSLQYKTVLCNRQNQSCNELSIGSAPTFSTLQAL